jgi:hypothetical protein
MHSCTRTVYCEYDANTLRNTAEYGTVVQLALQLVFHSRYELQRQPLTAHICTDTRKVRNSPVAVPI